jgi:TRAP-type C4-dicarboxylate transport system permease large subunit
VTENLGISRSPLLIAMAVICAVTAIGIVMVMVVVVVVEISLITPPIGLNVFVLKSMLPDVPVGTIFRGIIPFFAADIFRRLLVVFFPGIALFLPSVLC